ncbi:MAG: hypothetical protein JJU36_07315 [Phycisphaeraceae bacterium]|nr:hypothetical protein [Phycisphaeraceae bacterium]
MSHRHLIWQTNLQRFAVVAACVAAAVAFITLLLLYAEVRSANARIVEVERAREMANGELLRVERELSAIDDRIKSIERDIDAQLRARYGLELEMAEVMARASALQDERARFHRVRDEVERELQRMDDHYLELRSLEAERPNDLNP